MKIMIISVLLAAMGSGLAVEWPSWRGPGQNGFVPGPTPPAEFSEDSKLVWKAELPGRGCSTPVVVEGKIIVTSEIDGLDGVTAYDWNGSEVWRTTFDEARPGRGRRVGSSANSSPVTDGKGVYVFFKSGTAAGLDLDGKVKWSVDIFDKFGKDTLGWDVGSSPVLAGGNVVVTMMQTNAPSYLVALDPETGETVWRAARDYDTGPESGDAYTTPLVVTLDGRETIVCWGADHLTGQDAATGEILWSCGGFNPEKLKAWRVIASAVAAGDIALVPYGRGAGLAGVRMGGEGDVTDSAILWHADLGTDSATPAATDDHFIVLTDSGPKRGTITCFEAESGKVVWRDRLPKGAQIYYASPLIVDDMLMVAREDGTVFTAEIGDDGLVDVRANAVGEGVIASPVVIDGKLLIRGERHLFHFGG